MKKLLFSFGFLTAILTGLIIFQPNNTIEAWGSHWSDETECQQLACGRDEGEKTQTKTSEKCEYDCPTIHFEWKTKEIDVPEHYVYTDKIKNHKGHYVCPNGYQNNPGKWNCRKKIDATYKYTKHSADVHYEKSNDPHKCHRPSDSDLMNVYGMDHDAKQDFKKEHKEWKFKVKSSCEDIVERRTVTCTVPAEEVQACETTPTPTPSDEPTPTPSEEPTPTPSDEPKEPKKEKSSLYVSKLLCFENEFRAEMDLKSGDRPLQDILVTFTYNGASKNAYTNKDGRAKVSFAFAGENTVKASPSNGYKSQESKVTAETNCFAVGGISTPSTSGQVLGANTYAPTGILEDMLMSFMGLSGATMTVVGAKLHAKKKN